MTIDPDVEEAWRAWREAVEFAETFVESAPGLDVTGNDRSGGAIGNGSTA